MRYPGAPKEVSNAWRPWAHVNANRRVQFFGQREIRLESHVEYPDSR